LKVSKASEVWEEYGELTGKASEQAQASNRRESPSANMQETFLNMPID
jgi:hypothetical protein